MTCQKTASYNCEPKLHFSNKNILMRKIWSASIEILLILKLVDEKIAVENLGPNYICIRFISKSNPLTMGQKIQKFPGQKNS